MDDRSTDDALQSFLERTKVPQPTADDVARLDSHVQRDPPTRRFSRVDRIVLWSFVSIFVCWKLLKLVKIVLEHN